MTARFLRMDGASMVYQSRLCALTCWNTRRNFGSWHKVRAQPGAFEGTETAALLTLGVEGPFIGALQT